MARARFATPVVRAGARVFYRRAMRTLQNAGVPFLVGGAYAFERCTGIARDSKDLDLFVRPSDCRRALDVLARAGYRTELACPVWLGKVFCGRDYIDVIFSSGNGVAEVDDGWFTHAIPGRVLDLSVDLCPIEETIWSKAYVMERERFDGADVLHLLRGCGHAIDWQRLLARFGAHWRVLLSHLVLYGFVYPGEQSRVPAWVLEELIGRLRYEKDTSGSEARLCQGTVLSAAQYLVDIEQWGYEDARLRPRGKMTREDTAHSREVSRPKA
jgi:hypothetical protein